MELLSRISRIYNAEGEVIRFSERYHLARQTREGPTSSISLLLKSEVEQTTSGTCTCVADFNASKTGDTLAVDTYRTQGRASSSTCLCSASINRG